MTSGAETKLGSVSSRLLWLTMCFVMVVEVFIYVPSIAQFRLSFLQDRMAAAQIAAYSLMEAPSMTVSEPLKNTLLNTAGVIGVVLRLPDRSRLVLEDSMPDELDAMYDLRTGGPLVLIGDAFATLARGGDGVIQVVDEAAGLEGEEIAVILREDALFAAMMTYSRNILLLSVLISLFTAGLVFLSLNWLLVRPMTRITASMVRFREKPGDPERILKPSRRTDEVGLAERELARMQEELRRALNQRRRLANLGAAVSKVNHDLRNILATAQLSSDSLLMAEDPRIKALSERLIASIDRAIGLCERTLKYGRAEEPPPEKKPVALRSMAEEVALSLGLDSKAGEIDFDNAVAPETTICADPDHLFRILMNLGRNAVDAMQGEGGRLRISASHENGSDIIRVADTGPGLPEKARSNLFVPFKGAAGGNGTGLGLAIVAELAEANGGAVSLEQTGPQGTVFCIRLPRGNRG